MAPGRGRQGQNPVEVDLRRRQGRNQFRLGAERQLGVALEPDGPLVGAVLQLDLLQQRPRPIGTDMAAEAPGFDDAIRAAAHRTRQLQRAFKTRKALFDPDRAVEVEDAGMVDRRHVQPQLDAAVVGRAVDRQLKRIVLPLDGERPFAFDGSEQRAHLADEFELLKRQARAAGRIGEGRAAILDLEMLDRDRVGIEPDRGGRPDDPPGWIEAQGELGPLQSEVRRPQDAAQQIAQGEFDSQRARTRLGRIARTAELDLLQRQCRRRQEADVDRAGDPDLEPGEASDLGLELGPVASPIDEERPHQRRDQRQNDCNASTQQRRLHAVSTPSDLESALETASETSSETDPATVSGSARPAG